MIGGTERLLESRRAVPADRQKAIGEAEALFLTNASQPLTKQRTAHRRTPETAVEFIYTPVAKEIESLINELCAMRRLRHVRRCRNCVDDFDNSLVMTPPEPIT